MYHYDEPKVWEDIPILRLERELKRTKWFHGRFEVIPVAGAGCDLQRQLWKSYNERRKREKFEPTNAIITYEYKGKERQVNAYFVEKGISPHFELSIRTVPYRHTYLPQSLFYAFSPWDAVNAFRKITNGMIIDIKKEIEEEEEERRFEEEIQRKKRRLEDEIGVKLLEKKPSPIHNIRQCDAWEYINSSSFKIRMRLIAEEDGEDQFVIENISGTFHARDIANFCKAMASSALAVKARVLGE